MTEAGLTSTTSTCRGHGQAVGRRQPGLGKAARALDKKNDGLNGAVELRAQMSSSERSRGARIGVTTAMDKRREMGAHRGSSTARWPWPSRGARSSRGRTRDAQEQGLAAGSSAQGASKQPQRWIAAGWAGKEHELA